MCAQNHGECAPRQQSAVKSVTAWAQVAGDGAVCFNFYIGGGAGNTKQRTRRKPQGGKKKEKQRAKGSPVGKDISQDNRSDPVDRRNALRTQIPQAEVAARDRNLHARVAHPGDRNTTETSRRNFQNYVIVESFTKRTVNDDGFTPPQKMNDTTAARDLGQQASRSARQHYYNRQRKRQR
ncbi:hypothetical protein FN846DRAFT_996917 [Sphaerosporella brunnea]|uniref:Uncharacterized protein n=1 Tax=Sphaerosporella brunnea TaxID=1250544 RepID=A0A5J5EJN4_9PEZI|nr:hypothetical protein FN846DRAFT_996917 [Sphaerosporella brunnea]